ncbi:sterol carrier family protein [Luteococcus peritonei]|uniref:Sterol carrier family protein n=1 Tax=Luteococcus peritonei TaxID=88874 RepID=A0ABW4RXR7_9ACTN
MSIMAARGDRTLRTTVEVVSSQCRALAGAHGMLDQASRARMVVLVDDVLAALGSPTTARPQSWASLLNHRSVGSRHLDAMTEELAQSTRADALGRLCTSRTAVLGTELAGQLPATVSNQFGNSAVVDYLRATLLELAVLSLAGGPQCLQPAALRSCVRSLSQALGERFAGHTIEARIPPASAVQLSAFGQGPTHTRGTPPNVVETDELTWLELGTGLTSLEQAVEDRRVTASGVHALELARMLPVVDLSRLT